jgi:hypothetical protein
MIMKRKSLTLLFVYSIIFVGKALAQNTAWTPNRFFIIPEETNTGAVLSGVRNVSSGGGNVRDRYNQQADNWSNNLWNQFSSGIMTWDTLIGYTIYLVRFLSQIALVIGAVMIIYAWYIYATAIFWSSGDGTAEWNKAIKYAIQWIVVVASSYAIMRILTSAFLS